MSWLNYLCSVLFSGVCIHLGEMLLSCLSGNPVQIWPQSHDYKNSFCCSQTTNKNTLSSSEESVFLTVGSFAPARGDYRVSWCRIQWILLQNIWVSASFVTHYRRGTPHEFALLPGVPPTGGCVIWATTLSNWMIKGGLYDLASNRFDPGVGNALVGMGSWGMFVASAICSWN